MGRSKGKTVPVSLFRRLVTDLMHFSVQVPAVTADRMMHLADLVSARQECSPRPSWTAIFTKAFAIAAQDFPEFRRAYMKFPWPRYYEHPHNVGVFNVERTVNDERIVMYCHIRSPEHRPLSEIDAILRRHQETPVEELRSYQRSVGMSKIPWPFRRIFWWLALNVFGRRRCHNYGTYSLSSVAPQGSGLLTIIPILTSALHYGLFDEQSRLHVRITWDHRVMDGATVAEFLRELDGVLHREILAEIQALSAAEAA